MNGKFTLPDAASTEASKQQMFDEIHQYEVEREEEAAKPSPYNVHRDKIFALYSSAIRMQNLILHLYNQKNKCDLGGLLANADIKHRKLAIDIIRRHSILGENDKDFMNTAVEIQARRKKRSV